MFVHLRVHSDYSLGLSAIKAKELANHCRKEKMPAVGLCDYGNLFGILEFSLSCVKNGVQPIIGAIVNVEYQISESWESKKIGELLLIASNDIGYKNLLKIVSLSYLKREGLKVYVNYNDFKDNINGIIVLCNAIKSPYGIMINDTQVDKANQYLNDLKTLCGENLYLEVIRNAHNNYENHLLDSARTLDIPIVATNDVFYLTPQMREAQDALLCISSGAKINDEHRLKAQNDNYLKSTCEMRELFADLPEAIENTINIAKRCTVFAYSSKPMLPRYGLVDEDENQLLDQYAQDGLKERLSALSYEVDEKVYYDRLNFELSVIKRMQFPGYFLIVSDFIIWSKEQGIPVGPGRGSGAGSVVAWALKITDLDPLKYGLLFERFLNPDRVSMPDFDIDFCQERREEVVKYVRSAYGEDRVANIITFGKLQPRAVLRDVGRVLDMNYIAVDKICKMVPNNPANPVTLSQAISLDKELQRSQELNPVINKLLSIGLKLEGMNRHASIHAAGIVIADRPLIELVPLYQDPHSVMPVIQYNYKDAEEAGLVKFDFLGLKTLTVIAKTCDFINKDGTFFKIDQIQLDDKKTYKLLERGETVGVFQFESAGMKEAIKKLRPDRIEDLIALGSLYRPGPMDNIPSYINRKHGREKAVYLHPLLEEILKETFGIIVYQEQVIMIAQALAGYTLGEADLLRRAMGKKIRAEMEANRAVFISGAMKKSISKDLAEDIFNLIDKFASYGFNKSHAAAYAIISYQTAYLKANYPLEFFTASINLEINDTDKINMFISDAKHYNIKILPPNINHSKSLFSIENGNIRFGLSAIKTVGDKAINEIINIRSKTQFKNLEDFLRNCGQIKLNKRMLENLIRSGAFDGFDRNRHKLFVNIEKMISWSESMSNNDNNNQINLFDSFDDCGSTSIELQDIRQWNDRQTLDEEFKGLGFYLSSHPIEEYLVKLKKKQVIFASQVSYRATEKSTKINLAGVITSKRVKSSPKGKYAFLQISDQTSIMDISLFDESLLVKYTSQGLLEVGKLIYINADVRKDDTGLRVIIDSITEIDEAVSQVKSFYTITIKDIFVIDDIKDCMSEYGVPFKLIIQTPDGHEIQFKNNESLYVDDEKLSELRYKDTISIIEQ